MPPHPAAPLPDFLYSTAWKEDRTQALTELALRMGFRGIEDLASNDLALSADEVLGVADLPAPGCSPTCP